MKANLAYNDLTGTVSADIANTFTGGPRSFNLKSLLKYIRLDEGSFKFVGLSITGTNDFDIRLICVDKKKSTNEKEHIVSMSYEVEYKKEILEILFKQLQLVLYNRSDKKYSSMECDEEVNYGDYHEDKGE